MFLSFCGVNTLLESEQITLDSYNQIQSILKQYIDKGYKLDNYGNDTTSSDIWEYGNKFLYLIEYLSIVRQYIQADYNNNTLKTQQEYREIYKIDCIKKKFTCAPIPFNIDNLLSIFGLGLNSGFDGINYMELEGTHASPFIVQ